MRTLLIAIVLMYATAVAAEPCIVPDNGTGTVTLPPAGCEFVSPDEVFQILNDLPPGTTIELDPIHKDFICPDFAPWCSVGIPPFECETVGGSLGGNGNCFDSTLELHVTGTGPLTGFNRILFVPTDTEVHTGPRNPGDPVQSFPTEMVRWHGQIFGDPDFLLLEIRAGTAFGLPSPGTTTLTQLPDGRWNVDSFFDVTYEIDFVGAPGSMLDGMAGTTQGTIRMQAGGSAESPVPTLSQWGLITFGMLLLTAMALALRRRQAA